MVFHSLVTVILTKIVVPALIFTALVDGDQETILQGCNFFSFFSCACRLFVAFQRQPLRDPLKLFPCFFFMYLCLYFIASLKPRVFQTLTRLLSFLFGSITKYIPEVLLIPHEKQDVTVDEIMRTHITTLENIFHIK